MFFIYNIISLKHSCMHPNIIQPENAAFYCFGHQENQENKEINL